LQKRFAEIGFEVQVKPLTHFEDSYGLEVSDDEDEDENEDEEDDGSELDGKDDDDSGAHSEAI
jgi:hypothetical protein